MRFASSPGRWATHLPITAGLVSVAVFLLLWWTLPSVFTEGIPRRGDNKAPRDTADDVSKRMGTWLSRGLDATSVLTLLLWTSTFLVPIVYFAGNRFGAPNGTFLDDYFGPIMYSQWLAIPSLVSHYWPLPPSAEKQSYQPSWTLIHTCVRIRFTLLLVPPSSNAISRYSGTFGAIASRALHTTRSS